MKRMVKANLTTDPAINRSLMPDEMVATINKLQDAFGKMRLTKFEVEQGGALAIKIDSANREYTLSKTPKEQ